MQNLLNPAMYPSFLISSFRCGGAILLLLAALFSVEKAAAQQLLELGKVDVVAIQKGKGSLRFYQKKGKQYKEVIVSFGTSPQYVPSVRVDSIARNETEVADSNTVLLPVKHIRSCNSEAFYAYLSGNQFGASKALRNEDTIFTSLQPCNPFVLLIKETTKSIADKDENGNIKEWDTDNKYYTKGFCLLRLDKDKYLAVFARDEGYFIPCRDGDRLFVHDFLSDNHARHTPADKSWQQDIRKIREVFKKTDRSIQGSCYALDTGDDRFRLVGDFNLPLLPGVYDEIKLGYALIFARKGKMIEIYNYFLQLLIPDARSYTVEGQLAFVLTGNQVVPVDMLGIVGPGQKYLPDRRIPYYGSRHEYYRLDHDHNGNYTLYSERESDRTRHIIRQNNPVAAAKGLTIDEATPLWVNEQYGVPVRQLSVTVSSKGRFGLFDIPYPRWTLPEKAFQKLPRDTVFTGDTLRLKELLPLAFDSIVPLKHGEYLKICSKGLAGLYPVQHEAVYTAMEVQYGFLRFTMPGGKKGWMNLKTQDEFMDE